MFNSPAITDQVPYYAYVQFANNDFSFYGGGALISHIHVLTSAANVQGFDGWLIGVGGTRGLRNLQTTHDSNRAIHHPNYQQLDTIRFNDIGIIFLRLPVQLATNVFPIALRPLQSGMPLMPNEQGMVLGFAGSQSTGATGGNQLMQAHVRIRSTAQCTVPALYPDLQGQQQFCAEDVEQQSNFCLGDQVNDISNLSASHNPFHSLLIS